MAHNDRETQTVIWTFRWWRDRFAKTRIQKRDRSWIHPCCELFEQRLLPAITIQFDYSLDTNDFFTSAARRDVLELAGDMLSSRLNDTLSAISPSGSNTWQAIFTHPSTGAEKKISNLSVPADTLIVYVGASDIGSLGFGGPGGFSASGSDTWLKTVKARGEAGALTTTKTDLGPWGGSITFGLNENWHFGATTDGLDDDESDFFSVALHELGHVLGFGTADSWEELVSGGEFTGAASVAEYDGIGDVPLSGDLAHWESGTLDEADETAMDPEIFVGERKLFTPLDFAALDDIGWEVSAPLSLDFGDAPTAAQSGFSSSYPTTLSNNAARHVISGPRFGASVDDEADGQPSASASGDDANDMDDEEGVRIQTSLRAGEAGLVSVNLQNASTAKLDAWIDWNRDGDWNDADEQIFTNKTISAGDNTLTFSVLASAADGTTFARFRVSTSGGLAPTGLASNGEVEDVRLSVIAADTTIAPRDVLIYYSYPSLINGAGGNITSAASKFGQYDYVVLGDGLEDSSHDDHANTMAIVNHASTSNTQFFGYIDLGVSTQNLSMTQIQQRVDQWLATGVDGIFFDDFGFDFGTTRTRQNDAVNYAHSLGLPVVANGFFVNDVFSSAVVSTFNPSGAATRLTNADFYLFESYQIQEGEIVGGAAWRAKADALAAFRATLGTQVLAVTTNDADNTFSQSQFDYGWYSALLDGYEGYGWGEFDFAASTATAPFRSRPTDNVGTAFTSGIATNNAAFQRTTNTGKVWVNSSEPTADFGNSSPTLANPIADQIATGNNNFSFTLPADTFRDLDGDSLTLSANGLPSWLTFNASTRTFSGLPTNSHVGELTVMVTATDPSSASASDSFLLTVNEGTTPDIVLTSVTANGRDTLTVNYDILNANVFSPFNLRLVQSNDAVFGAGDTTLSTVTISGSANLAVGSHSLNFTIGKQVLLPGAGVSELSNDYFLLAVADPTNAILEDDADPISEDNVVTFVGAYSTGKTVHVHGGTVDDIVTLTYPTSKSGNFTLGLTGSATVSNSIVYSQATQFRIRTHDGDDIVNVVNTAKLAARAMFELGGDGDDTLHGADGADTINGGAGDDTLSGKLGNDKLDGGSGSNRLSESGDVNFKLTDSSLTGVGKDVLVNLQFADLMGGASANSFTVSEWTGLGDFVGGGAMDTIVAAKDRNFVLSDGGLETSDGMSILLSGFEKATLTGDDGNNSFTVGDWSGTGKINGGSGNDRLIATRDANLTLSSSSLSTPGFGTLSLSKLEAFTLTGGLNANVFTIGEWKGTGSLIGGGGSDTLAVIRNSNMVLSDALLTVGTDLSLTLSGIGIAKLTGGSKANVFNVGSWTGTGTLTGLSGKDRVEATRNTDMTLTNVALAAAGFGTMTLDSIETANLAGGNGNNILHAAAFTLGSVTLQGGNGDDVLIGGSQADSLDGGGERDLLIGGANADTLSGNAGDDILIGGTTSHSDSLSALNALVAEWTSDDVYATRVSNLQTGGGENGMIQLNGATVQNDSSADRLLGEANLDWFFMSAKDVLSDFSSGQGEIKTTV